MIPKEEILIELLSQYGINYSQFSDEQKEALLENGKIDDIRKALDFLVGDINISSNNIEKCPSVLYFNVNDLKDNYNFLINKDINSEKIESCLHILSSKKEALVETYNYVYNNYGYQTFNKNVSILSVSVDRIKDLENKFSKKLGKEALLSAAITTLRLAEINSIINICESNGVVVTGSFFQRGINALTEIINICKKENIEVTGSALRKDSLEVQRIINVCKKKNVKVIGSVFLKDSVEVGKIIDMCHNYDIEITGSVFRRDANEIEDIVKACNECGIKISGTVFLRTGEEIKEIHKICKKYDIPLSANVFKKSASQIEAIAKVCKKYNMSVSTSLFSKSASSLDKSMKYLVTNYDDKFLKPLIVTIDSKHLEKVFPHLEGRGTLDAVIESPAILTLKYDELIEREEYIRSIGEADVVGNKFNSIYGLSKKRYSDKKKNNVSKGGVKNG